MTSFDAVVVGSGPNGLAAALTLAKAGRSVVVFEAAPTIGGGSRSAELTLPGVVHDVCATSFPLTASRFFRELETDSAQFHWIDSPLVVAHPFDDGSAAAIVRSLCETAASLGEDEGAYRALFQPFVAAGYPLIDDLLAPLHLPGDAFNLMRFGKCAVRSANALVEGRFKTETARSLFAGLAAHSMLPLDRPGSAAAGLLLGTLAHLHGWPMAAGGARQVVDTLANEIRSLGGEIRTGITVESIRELPAARAMLFAVAPRNVVKIAGSELPDAYCRALGRFKHGPGSYKVDFALDCPVPWTAERCHEAGVVHLGGTFAEIAAGERAVSRGEHPDRPFVLLSQPSLFDPSRAPAGKHTVWAYCHVPPYSTVDMTERIERQIERFAPGFGGHILAKRVTTPADLEAHNANYIGGDIGGGLHSLRQQFTRPVVRWNPYATPNPRIYLCSASTPPGGGVHGMCGWHAATRVLRRWPNEDNRMSI